MSSTDFGRRTSGGRDGFRVWGRLRAVLRAGARPGERISAVEEAERQTRRVGSQDSTSTAGGF